jgi:dipeptidyl aminopeptidase/acylaminoacyl peptidase
MFLDLRYSAVEAPNYFVTRDYKNIKFITDIQPQKRFNWHITELHKWRSLDGTVLSGILYKPENFDSTKKYPVIFQFYERRSQQLNLFIRPAFSNGEINIPAFVSAEYLVFEPDIHYKTGNPGQSALDAVVSAAKYLSEKPWVNPSKMGLQGHSFGGFETGYIITHSNIFAAASSAAGVYDLIGSYCSDLRGGYNMYHKERGQGRMGKTLWEMKDQFIENSAIYRADRINTPLLIMHNKEDGIVPFSQGVEIFTALRRLKKRVWMLQYDGEGHSIDDARNAFDYHTRLFQFFNHYLKDELPPKWMTNGVPAKMKGIESGYELD